MHKSINKVNDIKFKNKKEHRDYRRDKKQLIKETDKKVKHDHVRIGEETKLNKEMQSEVQKKMNDID